MKASVNIYSFGYREVWVLGNQVLYDLCRKYPLHSKDDVIIAKILLIGRVYAAAIERRKPGSHTTNKHAGDDFYTKVVAPHIRKSGIDGWLKSLPPHLPSATEDSKINKILSVHGKVTKLFSKISGLEKRSLASKYLHFHRPDLFFIYDSRSVAGIRALTTSDGVAPAKSHDPEYAKFFRRCLSLCQARKLKHSDALITRHLDDFLITLAERKK